jgi:para-nitrobenzyl esterase
LIFDFHPDGTASAIPDVPKARLDVMQLATEFGKAGRLRSIPGRRSLTAVGPS